MKQYLILTFYQRVAYLKNELPITKVSKSVFEAGGLWESELIKTLKDNLVTGLRLCGG